MGQARPPEPADDKEEDMLPIKNTSMLQNTGDPLVRGPLLRMANHALAALNSERLIPSLVRLEGGILHVGDTV